MADLSNTAAWTALTAHADELTSLTIKDLFDVDPNRLKWGNVEAAGLTLDITKNLMTAETLQRFVTLAEERDLSGWRDRMTFGEAINTTEARAALHMALRGGLAQAPTVEGVDVSVQVAQAKMRFLGFTESVRRGDVTSSTGKTFRTVIHIGIGGSDLGPRLGAEALRPYGAKGLEAHFVANVDGAELALALEGADPETTLFVVASKTFTTQETIENAKTARAWLQDRLPTNSDTAAHFAGVTANTGAAEAFGIKPEQIFPTWEWVGGRFSVWSSVGLSLALVIGAERFEEFLSGAAEMDRHFCTAPLERNLPALMAFVGIWNQDHLGYTSQAILPYDQSLGLFPDYLQQLEMESNGKSVQKDGSPVAVPTAPVVWGGAGTTGQHAFYQWLHQGNGGAFCDIILPLSPHHDHAHHHDILVSHAIAQSEALAFGRDETATRNELTVEGLDEADVARLLPHRTFRGNRPVSILTMDRLTPKTLGALLALYEHKVFTQGILWNINSFDQWGVELGKRVAGKVLTALVGEGDLDGFDPSTQNLIEAARAARSAKTSET